MQIEKTFKSCRQKKELAKLLLIIQKVIRENLYEYI